MASEAKLKLLLDLQDNVSKQLDQTSESIKNVEDKTKNLKESFSQAAIIGTAGFTAISAIALKTFSDYTESAQQMKIANLALKNGVDSLSGDALAKLQKEAGGAGSELSYLQGLMTEASDGAVKLGMDDEDTAVAFAKLFTATGDAKTAMSDLKTAQDLAAYSGQDLMSATQAMINVHAGKATVLRQFGINVSDVATAEEALAIVSQKTKGAAEELAKPMDILKVTMGNLSENIGQAFAPALDSLITAITPLINMFANWAAQNPTLIATIAAISAGLFGVLAVVGTLGLVIPTLTIGFTAIGGVLTVVGAIIAALGGPILIIVGILTALVAVGKLEYDNWDSIAKFAQTAWTSVGNAVSGAMASASSAVSTAWQTIQNIFWTGVDFVIGAWASLLDFLFPGWDATLMKIYNDAVAKFTMVKDAVTVAITAIVEWFTKRFDEFTTTWSGIWENIKTIFTNVWDGIKAVAEASIKWITDGLNVLMSPVNNLINSLNTIISLAKTVMSTVGSAVGSAVSTIVSRGSSITGKASGGSVSGGTPYLIGENGPELFVPGRSGTIIPNGSFAAAGAGGNNFVINISGTFADDEESALRMGNSLVRYLKDNLKL